MYILNIYVNLNIYIYMSYLYIYLMIGRSKSLNDVHQCCQCTPVMFLKSNKKTSHASTLRLRLFSQLARTREWFHCTVRNACCCKTRAASPTCKHKITVQTLSAMQPLWLSKALEIPPTLCLAPRAENAFRRRRLVKCFS